MTTSYTALGEHVGDVPDVLHKLSSGLSQGASSIFAFTEEAKRLNAVIKTDVAAKNALGQALYSKKPEDMDTAQAAIHLMDSFATGLSPESQQKRHEAAQRMVADARNDSDAKRDASEKASSDAAKREAAVSSAAYFIAATEILKKIETPGLPTGPGFPGTSLIPYNPSGSGGFFSTTNGPILLLGGVFTAALLFALFRRKPV